MSFDRCSDPERHWLERLSHFDNERLRGGTERWELAPHWEAAHWIADVASSEDVLDVERSDEDSINDEDLSWQYALSSTPEKYRDVRARPHLPRSKTDRVVKVSPSETPWSFQEASKTFTPARTRRHDRSASAPQLPPAQELHVNTFLPLKLPPKNLTAIPSPIQQMAFVPADEVADNDSSGRASQSKTGSSSNNDEIHRVDSTSSLFSSLSDGSYHGDAGDEDPEDQLANAIIQQQQQQQYPGHVAKPLSELTVDISKELGSSSDIVDEEDEAIREQGGYMHHVASFFLKEPLRPRIFTWSNDRPHPAPSSSLSPPSPSPYAINNRLRSQSANAANLDDILQHDRRVKYFSSASPSQLSAEMRDRQRARVDAQASSAKAGRSSSVLSGLLAWLLPSIEEDEASVNDQEDAYCSNDHFRNRSATSLMSLPSLLSPTETLPSLSNTSSFFGDQEDLDFPISPSDSLYSADENDDEDEAPRSFGQVRRTHSGFGLSTYADETPHAFCDSAICGTSDAAQRRRLKEHTNLSSTNKATNGRQRVLRRNHDIMMRMTPAADFSAMKRETVTARDNDSITKSALPSPLWDERLDHSPYQRSWSSVLNLS